MNNTVCSGPAAVTQYSWRCDPSIDITMHVVPKKQSFRMSSNSENNASKFIFMKKYVLANGSDQWYMNNIDNIETMR